MWEGILTTHELELWLSDMWRWPALTRTRRNPFMANTYPSLSVKGMIYIHSGSPQISVSSQKTAQGRRGRSEDPVYTACGPKICMGTMVYDVFKSQMHNFDGPRQVHYKPNTVPDSKPGSIPMMSVSQLRGGSGGDRPTHALKLYFV